MEYIAHIDEKDKKMDTDSKKFIWKERQNFQENLRKIWERRLGLL